MHYVALIYQDEQDHAKWSQKELAAEQEAYMAFGTAAGKFLVGDGVATTPSSTATTVRVRNGETLRTNGPVASTEEQYCGHYLLNCHDLDEALEVAAKIPSAKNGAIEIRPIIVFELER